MKTWMVLCLLLPSIGAGCETKSKANAQTHAAFLAGQRQAAASMQSQAPSVWMVGNVKTPLIPWTNELTLARALLAAEYQGVNDPSQITILRNGQPPIYFDPRKLLQGEDMPLQAGDRVEIRP